jgi:DNA polymerase III alpha subunit
MSADVDIDFPSDFNPIKIFPELIRASQSKKGNLTPHQCGFYFQNIVKDILTDLACIDYEIAEEIGYQKIDFLHLGVYDHFTSRAEIEELINVEPDWNLLLIPSKVEKLFHLAKHYDVLEKIKPKSIDDVADALALIRPGKRELLDFYLENKQECRKILYSKTKTGYSFKKSHGIAYALIIVLQLHMIEAGII